MSVFHRLEKRLELHQRLRERGYRVRMHSYEYFIAARKFVCFLVLNPQWSSAEIYRMKWNLEEAEDAALDISEILTEMDPSTKITVR